MSLPPFVVVHRPGVRPKDREETVTTWLADIHREAPDLGRSLDSLKAPLRTSLLYSTLGRGEGGVVPTRLVALDLVTRDLERQKRVETVGLWDLGSRAGRLPLLVGNLNGAQTAFTFMQVQATAPMGFVSAKEWVAGWFHRHHRRTLSPADRKLLQANVIADDLMPRINRVRRDIGLDYLIAVTPHMVAGWDQDDGASWNFFNWWDDDGRNLLVSSYDGARYAREAKRPLEAVIAGIAISSLFVVANPRVEYHPETRGCLFDRNDDRDSIVRFIREPTIDSECRSLILPRYRDAALALVQALRDYVVVD